MKIDEQWECGMNLMRRDRGASSRQGLEMVGTGVYFTELVQKTSAVSSND